MKSTYQPFLIGEFKSGLYNYLKPWRTLPDAFVTLNNAFVYRGTLNKRNGYKLLGRMVYRDSATIATGNGGASYSGTLAKHPIVNNSLSIVATTSAGLETWTQSGAVLTGSLGDSGTINITTGAWAIILTGGRTIANMINIVGSYSYTNTASNPIMGLKQWVNESNGQTQLIAFDTKRMSVFAGTTFSPLNSVNEQIGVGDGTMGPFTFITGFGNITPYSFTLTDGTETFTSNGATPTGTLTGSAGGSGTITWATGSFTVTFNANTSSKFFISYSLAGDYFTGDNTNFFNVTNWQNFMYAANNKDRITLYNGMTLSRPPFCITQANFLAYVNEIATCLDVDVFKNRLLVQYPTRIDNPTSSPTDVPEPQNIRFSAITLGQDSVANNLVADVAGNGGFVEATTSDIMMSSEFLRDSLIVFFQNVHYIFRFTGNQFDPFRFDRINTTKNVSAPYGTIPYDEVVRAMGLRGLVATDGVNLQRYDVNVIDQFDAINVDGFAQCYGIRFDQTNQSWMLYPSRQTIGNSPIFSDSSLIYNFLENTWATYTFAQGVFFSCLGIWYQTIDATWNSFAVGQPNESTWEQATFPWNYYLDQTLSQTLAGGDSVGNIYLMDDDMSDTDNGNQIQSDIVSALWNPFVGSGNRTEFGYVDIYYTNQSFGASDDDFITTLTVNFYVDGSDNIAVTRNVELSGPVSSSSYWKRIYVNVVGQFIQMEIINQDTVIDNELVPAGPFQIQGMVLWAKDSGRLTPP